MHRFTLFLALPLLVAELALAIAAVTGLVPLATALALMGALAAFTAALRPIR